MNKLKLTSNDFQVVKYGNLVSKYGVKLSKPEPDTITITSLETGIAKTASIYERKIQNPKSFFQILKNFGWKPDVKLKNIENFLVYRIKLSEKEEIEVIFIRGI